MYGIEHIYQKGKKILNQSLTFPPWETRKQIANCIQKKQKKLEQKSMKSKARNQQKKINKTKELP